MHKVADMIVSNTSFVGVCSCGRTFEDEKCGAAYDAAAAHATEANTTTH